MFIRMIRFRVRLIRVRLGWRLLRLLRRCWCRRMFGMCVVIMGWRVIMLRLLISVIRAGMMGIWLIRGFICW